jgi:hypothetical protein
MPPPPLFPKPSSAMSLLRPIATTKSKDSKNNNNNDIKINGKNGYNNSLTVVSNLTDVIAQLKERHEETCRSLQLEYDTTAQWLHESIQVCMPTPMQFVIIFILLRSFLSPFCLLMSTISTKSESLI